MIKSLVIVVLIVLPALVQANEYKLKSFDVYDGDTLRKASIEIWPNLVQKVSIRINGIDTAEIRTRNKCEKSLGYKAKQALIDLIGNNQVTISNVKLGKYAGRVLADVSVNGINVADYMIKNGYARKYNGGKRAGWCE